ncbi:unnamed protein product [Ixodes pacificus]
MNLHIAGVFITTFMLCATQKRAYRPHCERLFARSVTARLSPCFYACILPRWYYRPRLVVLPERDGSYCVNGGRGICKRGICRGATKLPWHRRFRRGLIMEKIKACPLVRLTTLPLKLSLGLARTIAETIFGGFGGPAGF